MATLPTPSAMIDVGPVTVSVIVADITTLPLDAIVNAANTSLLGGGGVDGAIHRAAGPQLLAECATLGGCNTGAAKITQGYGLPARAVIHAVGPGWNGGGNGEEGMLASCYTSALTLAHEYELKSVAFPAVSTGVYRFPQDIAARIASGTVISELSSRPGLLKQVVFCCFSKEAADHYIAAWSEMGMI